MNIWVRFRSFEEQRQAHQAKVEQLTRNLEADERKAERIAALRTEREGLEMKRARGLRLGPAAVDRLEVGNDRGCYFLIERTGAQMCREAERDLRAIDVELERTEREGVPDPRADDGKPHPLYGRFGLAALDYGV